MSNILPLVSAELQTLDAVATTLLTFPLQDTWSGELQLEVSGELSGTPATAYGWRNRVSVSCNGGVAVVQATGAAEILDPAVCGVVVAVDTDGAASIRIRVTGVVGQTWNWVGKLQCVVHSAVPSGTVAFYDPGWAASCTPYQDFAYTGANLCTDPNCENVALWGVFNGATLTNEAGGVTGNCMKVLKAATAGAAYQVSFVAGRRYCVSIQGQSDGTASLSVGDAWAADNIIAWKNPGAVWTPYSKTNHLAMATWLELSKVSNAGSYVLFDDVVAYRVPILTQCDNLINAACCPLVQPGAASARPTYLNDAAAAAQSITGACFQYDGVGQYWQTNFIAVDDFTIGGWFWLASVGAGTRILIGNTNVAGGKFCEIYQVGSVLRGVCGLVGSLLAHGTALTASTWHHIMYGRSGTTLKLWLDGVSASNALASDPPTLPQWVMGRNLDGVADLFNSGYTGKLWFVNRLLTDADVLSNMYSTLRV